MKLGIGTYTYMWAIGMPGSVPSAPMRPMDLLRRAHELGVNLVQYGPNLPLSDLSEAELTALLDQASKWNIEFELGTKGLQLDHLRSQLQLAQRVGAKLLRTVPEYERSTGITEASLEQQLRAVMPDLELSGVRLAVENATIQSSVLASVLDRIGCPMLGITLDTVNSLAIPEGTDEVVRNLARHTQCLHVKDFSVSRIWHMMGFTVEGTPAGAGQLNIPRLLQSLADAGATPNAILELWPPQQESPAATIALEEVWARQSVAWLRQHITN